MIIEIKKGIETYKPIKRHNMKDENVSLGRQASNHYHIVDGLSLDSGWTEVDY